MKTNRQLNLLGINSDTTMILKKLWESIRCGEVIGLQELSKIPKELLIKSQLLEANDKASADVNQVTFFEFACENNNLNVARLIYDAYSKQEAEKGEILQANGFLCVRLACASGESDVAVWLMEQSKEILESVNKFAKFPKPADGKEDFFESYREAAAAYMEKHPENIEEAPVSSPRP